MQYERKICKIEERFIIEKQNLRILIFLTGVWGGNSFECALSKGGHPNVCKMRAGGGSGSKKAKKLRAHFMYGP